MFAIKLLKTYAWAISMSLALLLLASEDTRACTTFSFTTGAATYVAKNYDWSKEDGLIYVNKRGVAKQSLAVFPHDKVLTWISKFGSLTFNQYGRELPNAGMNEAGLVVEVMELDSSRYQQNSSEPSLNESQWVQYMLDNAASIRELKNLAARVRISKILVPLHYMACDSSGACVAVESLNGRLVVSDQSDHRTKVLTNHEYAASLSYLKGFEGFGGHSPAPLGYGSLERFVRTAFFLNASSSFDDSDNVAKGFQGLSSVNTPITQWSIVYDLQAKHIFFKSRSAPLVKKVDMSAFNFECATPVLALPMLNGRLSGDITARFVPYSYKQNADLVRRSLSGSVSEELIEAASGLPETTSCKL